MTSPRTQALEALRRYAMSYHESTHQFARWMKLPTNDGIALGEILWAESENAPLSPAVLSLRLGLTSGATNALINRLEDLALVTRSRESSDRRVVTLRATEQAHTRAEPFIQQSADELESALDDYDDETLIIVRDFLLRFATVLPEIGDTTRPSNKKAP